MNVVKSTHLKIKVKYIENLKTALEKVVPESKKVGFNNQSFSDDELKVLKSLSDSLK